MLRGDEHFDELDAGLADVTFCVTDLETTGTNPTTDTITEIGMVKVRGGEILATLRTDVGPQIRIEAVLPAVVEFAAGCVLVGHNLRFDRAFLDAALERAGWPRIAHRTIDTLALARRLVRDDVADCRLATLSERLRLDHRPTHRALDDAHATADLLHGLLERAGSLGVLALDDLLALPRLDTHPQVAKLRLAAALPPGPGLYLFRDARGAVLLVGRSGDVRQRVRRYFSRDERPSAAGLLRETHSIAAIGCEHPLVAAVTEVRLVHRHQPRFDPRVAQWRRAAYVTLPRLTVVGAPPPGGAEGIGPVGSRREARLIVEAIRSTRPSACTNRDLHLLLASLADRMATLAAARSYEAAAEMRDRAVALGDALAQQRRRDELRAAGRVRVATPHGEVELHNGVLARAWTYQGTPIVFAVEPPDPPGPPDAGPLPRHVAGELDCVAASLDGPMATAGTLRQLAGAAAEPAASLG